MAAWRVFMCRSLADAQESVNSDLANRRRDIWALASTKQKIV
jgi:hypothetical protein